MPRKIYCESLCDMQANRFWLLVFIFQIIAVASSAAMPFVSPVFGDDMVLQRGKPNVIWGWAKPGEKITVEIAGHLATAIAGSDGRWETKIEPPAPGGPTL